MTYLYTLSQSFHLYDISKWHVGDFFSIPASYSQGLQLYNISEDPTESRNLVRWMNPARLVCRNLSLPNQLWCFCQYANFVLLAHISRPNKHEQSSSPREEIIRRLQDLAIDQYRWKTSLQKNSSPSEIRKPCINYNFSQMTPSRFLGLQTTQNVRW